MGISILYEFSKKSKNIDVIVKSKLRKTVNGQTKYPETNLGFWQFLFMVRQADKMNIGIQYR